MGASVGLGITPRRVTVQIGKVYLLTSQHGTGQPIFSLCTA